MSETGTSTTPPEPLKLPQWDSEAQVAAWLGGLVATAVAYITLFHPLGGTSSISQVAVPAVASLIAGGVTIYNLLSKQKWNLAVLKGRVMAAPVGIDWTSATQVQAWLMVIAQGVLAVLAAYHAAPGAQSLVESLVPAVAAVVSGAVTVVHLFTHRTLTATLAEAQAEAWHAAHSS